MTPADIAKLRELREKAGIEGELSAGATGFHMGDKPIAVTPPTCGLSIRTARAVYFAAAVNALPGLLDEVVSLRERECMAANCLEMSLAAQEKIKAQAERIEALEWLVEVQELLWKRTPEWWHWSNPAIHSIEDTYQAALTAVK